MSEDYRQAADFALKFLERSTDIRGTESEAHVVAKTLCRKILAGELTLQETGKKLTVVGGPDGPSRNGT